MKEKELFEELVNALDVVKCFKHILMCAPISELPSSISTMAADRVAEGSA